MDLQDYDLFFIYICLLHYGVSAFSAFCLQCFDIVGWAVGRYPACKKT